MKFSLSTNWCNRRIDDGRLIAEKALELGFGELELGFHTTIEQVKGFKDMLDRIPVGSVHAFCPVPLSAPQGYPELYRFASADADERAIAVFHVKKNIEFAGEMGADTVVLHAGRASADAFLPGKKRRLAKRANSGAKLMPYLLEALANVVGDLEKHDVVLALENLPYLEGFPDENEMETVLKNDFGGRVKAWFDTGHHRVREMNGWTSRRLDDDAYRGMHLNDVVGFEDDHFAPGFGKVDFAALKPLAQKVRHVVFEPSCAVEEADLKKGIATIRELWQC